MLPRAVASTRRLTGLVPGPWDVPRAAPRVQGNGAAGRGGPRAGRGGPGR